MELNLEARLMGETLVLNRSLDPFFEDYIELNDLNVPLELRKNQVDDLMPTIKEGEVIEEFRTRNDARMDSKVFRYHSDCDHDKKIHIDCAYNLKEKMEYKGNNVVGTLMNILIFVGTFSILTDFVVLEDMDAYRDEGMGDVIFGKPFLREVWINEKRFEGMITIYNGIVKEDKKNEISIRTKSLRVLQRSMNIGPRLTFDNEDGKNGSHAEH
ncbi:hypothetical protein Tco_0453028 [Tanacetum coccineum]